jgi:hypothetical protein
MGSSAGPGEEALIVVKTSEGAGVVSLGSPTEGMADPQGSD